MAVDGTLVFDTKIDIEGMEKGEKSVKSQAAKLAAVYKKQGMSASDAFKKAWTEIERTSKVSSTNTSKHWKSASKNIGASIGGISDVFKGFAVSIGAAFGVYKLVEWGKEAVEFASDLQEVQNVVDTAFKDMSYKMEEFADTSIESFGISKLAAKQTGSVLMAMGVGMGVASDNASDMAVSLTGLSADMASFYNVSQDIAATALKSIYTGETETLKQFGVVMTEVNLQAFALAEGVTKTVSEMSQAEKVQLRYNFVMKQTALAQGDFAKTSDSWANQTRVLSEKWKEFLGILGTGLVRVLTPVMNYLSTSLSHLAKFASQVGSILSTLFAIKQTTAETSSASASLGSNASDASAGLNEMGEAAEEAAAKAGGTSGIDRLNNIVEGVAKNSEDAANELAKIEYPVATEVVTSNDEIDESSLLKSVQKLKEILEPTVEALGELWEAVKPLAGAVGEGFTGFVNTLLDVGQEALSVWMPAGIKGIAKAIKLVPKDTAIALGGALGGLAAAFLAYKSLDVVLSVINLLRSSFRDLLITLASHPILLIAGAIAALAGAVLALDKAKFDSSPIGKYVDKLNNLVEKAKSFNNEVETMLENHDERQRDIEAEYGAIDILADKYFELADKESLTNDEQLLLKTYAGELIKKVPELSGLINEQTGAYSGTKGEIEALITKTKEYYLVQAAQESLIEIATKQYEAEKLLKELTLERSEAEAKLTENQNALNKAIQESSVYGQSAAATAVKVFEAHQKYDKTINALEKSLGNLDTQIEETTGTQSRLSSEWDYATNYIKTYSSTVEQDMAKVESAVTTALDNVKRDFSQFKLPNLKVGVDIDLGDITAVLAKYNGISTGTISRYATGTVVPANYGEFLGILGDNKREPEVVSPLSTIEQAVENALNRRGGSGGSGEINLTINLDGKVVYKSVVKNNKEHVKATGKSELAY